MKYNFPMGVVVVVSDGGWVGAEGPHPGRQQQQRWVPHLHLRQQGGRGG